MLSSNYQVDDLQMTPLSTFKSAGFAIDLYTSKAGNKYVELVKDNTKFLALTSKGFEGSITLNTFLVEGNNANGQPRLYLTNNKGGNRTKDGSL